MSRINTTVKPMYFATIIMKGCRSLCNSWSCREFRIFKNGVVYSRNKKLSLHEFEPASHDQGCSFTTLFSISSRLCDQNIRHPDGVEVGVTALWSLTFLDSFSHSCRPRRHSHSANWNSLPRPYKSRSNLPFSAKLKSRKSLRAKMETITWRGIHLDRKERHPEWI